MKRSGYLAALVHPVRALPVAFALFILLGWLVLLLPFCRNAPLGEAVMPALFTSASAVTVTGLSTVETATYWTGAGHVVILIMMQVGGLGIVTFATVLGILVGGRLSVRTSLLAQSETHAVNLGDVGTLLRRVLVVTVGFQALLVAFLLPRYRAAYSDDWGDAAWFAVFHAVSAFNNAGLSITGSDLIDYAGDGLIILPLCLGVFVGAIGFPVLAELFRDWRRPSRWTIHTRLTVWGSLLFLVFGVLAFGAIEWSNDATLGPRGTWASVVSSIEGGVMPRSGGLSSIDYAEVRTETLGVTAILMFIGGGSASTAGGIKVTTFLLLAYVILAELRGDPEVTVGRRRVAAATLRQALTIALLSVMLLVSSTLFLTAISDIRVDFLMFESASAFGTAGLSTGATAQLPAIGQVWLVLLMFIGRVGPIAVASALTLRRRTLRYHLPEERPIIG